MDMYAMESADSARDDEPDGRRNVEGPGPCRKSIIMAELTAEPGHAAGPSPDTREIYVRQDLDSRVKITGVSSPR